MIDLDKVEQSRVLSEFLNVEYLRKVNEHGRGFSLVDYSKWLGVGAVNLNRWMNGNAVPSLDSIYMLARRYPELITLLDVPDARDDILRMLISKWGNWSDKKRQKLLKLIEKIDLE